MATIRQLQINLSARTERLEAELDKARREIRRTAQSVRQVGDRSRETETRVVGSFARMRTSVQGFAASLGVVRTALVAASVAVTGFLAAGFIRTVVANADTIGKFADALGVSVEGFQELTFAASQSGVELSGLQASLRRFTRRIAEAREGTGTAVAEFQKMGVGVRTTGGNIRRTEAILSDFADGFGKVESQTERVRRAFAFFGREGVTMVNLLRAGSAGLTAYAVQARNLGLVLEEELIREAEKLNDRFDQLSRIIQADLMRAVLSIAPQLEALAGVLIKISRSIGGFFTRLTDQRVILQRWLDGIESQIEAFQQRLVVIEEDGVNLLDKIAIPIIEFQLRKLIKEREKIEEQIKRLGKPITRIRIDISQPRRPEPVFRREDFETPFEETEAFGDTFDPLADQKIRQMEETIRLTREYQTAARDLGNQFETTTDQSTLMTSGIAIASSSMANFVTSIGDQTRNVTSAFIFMVQSILQALAQLAAQLIVTKALTALLGPGTPGVTGGTSGGAPGGLPDFDHGGIVTKPTVGFLAMNSRPEAVVPLDRADEFFGKFGQPAPEVNVIVVQNSAEAELAQAALLAENRRVTLVELTNAIANGGAGNQINRAIALQHGQRRR